MSRYKITIEYDGSGFSGWQIQPNAKTVEGTLEEAFSRIMQSPADVIGQGRTDSGVHARGQTAHIDLPDSVDVSKLIYGVNGLIGDEIYIREFEKVEDDFHARFDAISREYVYQIVQEPKPLMRHQTWQLRLKLDRKKLLECAELLLGRHDFAGFSKNNEDSYSTFCEIFESEFDFSDSVIRYKIRANRFLRNMVRRLVGAMVDVGGGKMSLEDFEKLLHVPQADIKSHSAPAQGLILEKVLYKNH